MVEKNNIETQENQASIEVKQEALLAKISKEFGLKIDNLKKLANFETSKGIEGLKTEIGNKEIESLKLASNEQLQDMFNGIKQFQKEKLKLKDFVSEEIASLSYEINKNEIDNIIPLDEEIRTGALSKRLSKTSAKKYLINPKNIIDNTIGGAIGLIDSSYEIGKLAVNLTIDIVKFPKDLYDLATGKAELSNDKQV